MNTELKLKRTSEKLKDLARDGQYGQPRTPRTFLMSPGYAGWYWGRSPFSGTTLAEWDHMAAVLNRYRRLAIWAEEVLPEWRNAGPAISYMDNSIEQRQVCKCGLHTRTVMITPPSGDACY